MRKFYLIILCLVLAAGVARATPPGKPATPMMIFEYGDVIIIAWPQYEDGEQKGRAVLTAVDAKTGEERWSRRGPPAAYTSERVFPLRDRNTLIVFERGTSKAIEVNSGKVLWESPGIVACGKNVALTRDGVAIDLGNGKQLWRLEHPPLWGLAGFDDVQHRVAVMDAKLPVDGKNAVTLSLVNLAEGRILHSQSIPGLGSVDVLEQQGDETYIVGGSTVLSVNLPRNTAAERMPQDSETAQRLIKIAANRFSLSRSGNSWEREGVRFLVSVEQVGGEREGLIRLTAGEDAHTVGAVRIPSVASISGPPIYYPRSSLLCPAMAAMICASALAGGGIGVRQRRNRLKP